MGGSEMGKCRERWKCHYGGEKREGRWASFWGMLYLPPIASCVRMNGQKIRRCMHGPILNFFPPSILGNLVYCTLWERRRNRSSLRADEKESLSQKINCKGFLPLFPLLLFLSPGQRVLVIGEKEVPFPPSLLVRSLPAKKKCSSSSPCQ